jgi:hypothetical protein
MVCISLKDLVPISSDPIGKLLVFVDNLFTIKSQVMASPLRFSSTSKALAAWLPLNALIAGGFPTRIAS